ncbi:MAG: polysaccharide deacetylase family protein [Candidatus Izemoplasmatales bacterium]|jgi:peptidoglycan/xylan/chitin deacetylase (PgdA/CDA1 family)
MEILWIFLGIIGMLMIWNIIRFLLFKKDFVPVLMYHRIDDSVTPSSLRYVKHKGKILDLDEMKTTLNQFDRQLEYLAKRGYTAVLMNDYLNIKAKKPVALTFDDGYLDNYTNAFPLLKKHNICATLYLCTDKITDLPGTEYLSWPDIKMMQSEGIGFGSHTKSHLWLNEEASKTQIEDEIVSSKLLIENKLNQKVNSFCYPAGVYTEEAIEVVGKHYDNAVITAYGSEVPLHNANPFLIEREAMSRSDSMLMFKLKLWGVHRFIRKSWLFKVVKKLRHGKAITEDSRKH